MRAGFDHNRGKGTASKNDSEDDEDIGAGSQQQQQQQQQQVQDEDQHEQVELQQQQQQLQDQPRLERTPNDDNSDEEEEEEDEAALHQHQDEEELQQIHHDAIVMAAAMARAAAAATHEQQTTPPSLPPPLPPPPTERDSTRELQQEYQRQRGTVATAVARYQQLLQYSNIAQVDNPNIPGQNKGDDDDGGSDGEGDGGDDQQGGESGTDNIPSSPLVTPPAGSQQAYNRQMNYLEGTMLPRPPATSMLSPFPHKCPPRTFPSNIGPLTPSSTAPVAASYPAGPTPPSSTREKEESPSHSVGSKDYHKGVPHIYHDYSQVPDPVGYVRKKTGGVSQPFPEKLHDMLEACSGSGRYDRIVSWLPHGRAFIVRQPKIFTSEIMPKYFRQTKLTSFQRQLNLYGFRRITQGADAGAYYHEMFLRERPALCQHMVRQKVKGTGHKQPSDASSEPNFYAMPSVVTAASRQEEQLQEQQPMTGEPDMQISPTQGPQAQDPEQETSYECQQEVRWQRQLGEGQRQEPEYQDQGEASQHYEARSPTHSSHEIADRPASHGYDYDDDRAVSRTASADNIETAESSPMPASPGMQSLHGAAHLLHGIASGYLPKMPILPLMSRTNSSPGQSSQRKRSPENNLARRRSSASSASSSSSVEASASHLPLRRGHHARTKSSPPASERYLHPESFDQV